MNPSGPRKYTKTEVDWGCRPGPISIWTLVIDQEMPVAEHVVDGCHLEVHVAKSRPLTAEHGELVMDRVDPHQAGGVADPV